MLLSLVLLALIAGIAIRQASQGLFSAFICAFLSVCCATFALGTYEWLTTMALGLYTWKPDFMLPVMLAVAYGLPLMVLRLVFDKLVHRACLVPALVDKAAGGLCGLVTAMTSVGILALSLQMLPFNLLEGSGLGFSRVTIATALQAANQPNATPPTGPQAERNLLLSPDRFVVNLAMVISDGIFSGERSFSAINPDLLQTVGWVGATHAEVSRYAPPGSISVVRAEPIEFVYKFTPADTRTNQPAKYEPDRPASGHEFRMVRVHLKKEARDERKNLFFTLRQFRLVGRVGDTSVRQFHAIAIQQEDAAQPENRHIRYEAGRGGMWPVVDKMFMPRDDTDQVEVVFEVPVAFRPSFIEFKRLARAAVSFDATASSSKPPSSAPPAATTPSPAPAAPAAPAARPEAPSGSRRRPAPTAEPPPTGRRGAGETQPPTGSAAPASGTGAGATPEQPNPPAAPPGAGQPAPTQPKPDDKGASAEPTPPVRPGGSVRGVAARSGQSHFGDELPLTLRSYRKLVAPELTGDRLGRGHIAADVDHQEGGRDPLIGKFAVPSEKRLLQLNAGRLQARSTLGRALVHAVTTVQNYYVEDTNGNRYVMAGKYAIANAGGRKVLELEYQGEVEETGGRVGPFREIKESDMKPDDDLVLLFLVEPGATIVAFSTGGDATRRDDLRADNLVAPR